MIQIAEHLFSPAEIGVIDRVEQDAAGPIRRVTCCGLMRPAWLVTASPSRMDALAATLLTGSGPVPLSLRPGRRLWARPRRIVRELRPEGAAFRLEFDATDPREEDIEPSVMDWSVSTWGETTTVEVPGTAPAPFSFRITAQGTLVAISLSDGARAIHWMGAMESGDTLELDGISRTARLNGTPADTLLAGDWPLAGPGNTPLRFEDDVDGDHLADIRVTWRNRWW
jgi:hypothetical protein